MYVFKRQHSDYICGFRFGMMEIVQEIMVFYCIFIYFHLMLPVQCGDFFSFLDGLPFNFNEFNRAVEAPSCNLPGGVCLTHQPEERS